MMKKKEYVHVVVLCCLINRWMVDRGPQKGQVELALLCYFLCFTWKGVSFLKTSFFQGKDEKSGICELTGQLHRVIPVS